jgi:O-antigen/teichoic acid export membrane protein
MPNTGTNLNRGSLGRIVAASARKPAQPNLPGWLPALNVSVSWTSNLVLVVGSFVVTPAILHAIGVDMYDTWLLVMSFVTQMRILDLGMTSGCMKFSAANYEKGDRARLLEVFNTSVAIFGASGLLACLVTFGFAYLLPDFYPRLENSEGIIIALGLGMAIDLVCRPFAASLRSRSYFFVYDGIELATYFVFKLGLVLYLSSRGLSLWWLAMLSLSESIVRNGTVLIIAMWLCNWTRRPNPLRAERTMMWMLLTYSGALFLMAIADLLRFQIDAAVIDKFLPEATGQITTYGIGFRLLMLATTTIGVIWSVLVPRFSGLAEKGATDELWALYRKATFNTGLLTVFGLVNITVFGLPFLKLWLHAPWVSDSYKVMLIAIPAYFIGLISGPAGGILAGVGKLKWQTAITIAEALCNVVLSIVLVQHYGIFGVCLGTAIPMILFRGVAFPIVLKKELGLSISSYYRMHLPILLLTLGYSALIAGFGFLNYHNYLELIIACTLSSAIFVALIFISFPQVREAINSLYERLKSRLVTRE